MRLIRQLVVVVSVSFLAACGGGSDGNNNTPDAPPIVDAPPPALSGLGQKCGAGLPACPANATECVGLAGGNGNSYCTPKCAMGSTGMTNAQGQLGMIMNPAPSNAPCTAAFSATPGMPACGLILTTVPADNPLQPNKAYTGIDLGCAVLCAAGACPGGMACNTGLPPGICEPI